MEKTIRRRRVGLLVAGVFFAGSMKASSELSVAIENSKKQILSILRNTFGDKKYEHFQNLEHKAKRIYEKNGIFELFDEYNRQIQHVCKEIRSTQTGRDLLEQLRTLSNTTRQFAKNYQQRIDVVSKKLLEKRFDTMPFSLKNLFDERQEVDDKNELALRRQDLYKEFGGSIAGIRDLKHKLILLAGDKGKDAEELYKKLEHKMVNLEPAIETYMRRLARTMQQFDEQKNSLARTSLQFERGHLYSLLAEMEIEEPCQLLSASLMPWEKLYW
jgi:hypothetical protein